jgi:hypothetical protein
MDEQQNPVDEIEVDTDGVQALVGRTIVSAFREPPSTESWPHGDQTLTLTVWRFDGWGYDASGLEIWVQASPQSTPER